jgi:preprotein translocase subunit YajC
MIVILFSGMNTVLIAETQTPSGTGSPVGGLTPFIPMLLIFAIFYFLILRPQQKKTKQHQTFLKDLKKGDMVVTNGGIIGMVKNLSDKIVTLEIDDGVCLKILRGQVSENAGAMKEAKA